MKISIFYDSKFGNGEKCVHYLSGALTNSGHETDVKLFKEIKPDTLPPADIYVFHSPTHVGNPPRKVKKFLKNLGDDKKGSKYALMATFMDANTKVIKVMDGILSSKGWENVSEALKIKVTGMKGPLEEGYEQKIDEFASKLVQEK